jgi:hypothetical protein
LAFKKSILIFNYSFGMKYFYNFLFACLLAMPTAQIIAQGCPPTNTATVGVLQPVTGCPPELQITAVGQSNSYIAYLYAANDLVNAISSIEMIGNTAPLAAFGDAAMTVGNNYVIKTIPVSTNVGTMPIYTIVSPPFIAPASIGARGAMMTGCGVIDNNIVTNIPPVGTTCAVSSNTFNMERLGGTTTANSIVDNIPIAQYLPNATLPLPLIRSAYLLSLYNYYTANRTIRFTYKGSTSIKGLFFELNETTLKVPRIAAQRTTTKEILNTATNVITTLTVTAPDPDHFSNFVNALNGLLANKFPNNSTCISIDYIISNQ